MALRGTLTHWKTQMLAKTLDIDDSHALGLLEAMWHVTAEDAPQGNIGRLPNKAIAMQMHTVKIEPDVLIKALLASHHLDRDKQHRLLVHDWHLYADYNVKRKLARNSLVFFTRNGPVHPLATNDASSYVNGGTPAPDSVPAPVLLKDNNTAADASPVSSSISSKWNAENCQSYWNRLRGPMRESKTLTASHKRLFVARTKDGLTAEVCEQAVVKMAATPHFRGETTGWIGDFTWLLGTHKESGEPNFRKVISGDYEPRSTTAKKKPAVAQRPPSYKDFAHNA